MRACQILLFGLLVNTFEDATATTAPKPAQLEKVSSFADLPTNGVGVIRGIRKRALWSHKAENEDEQPMNDSEERNIPGITKIITGLKNWADVEKSLTKQLMKGESNFAKLYKKKVDPYDLFTRFKFGDLSKAEKADSALYQMWAKYFDFWVNSNAGKVLGKR